MTISHAKSNLVTYTHTHTHTPGNAEDVNNNSQSQKNILTQGYIRDNFRISCIASSLKMPEANICWKNIILHI